MPLSHLTLTVSHLPTSTTFFLSCLQPLGYQFVGRHDEYIGFGSVPDEPADLWLAQEKPGTPAGAAHVAFPAPSKQAVDDFFFLAMKAGGKIHGEPKLRDPTSGYYSAAVIDFDGNSIEAVYRPNSSSTSKSQTGTATLKVIQNGSVMSRSHVSKAESVTSSSHKHETRPVALTAKALSAVDDARRSVAPSMHHSGTTPPPVPVQHPAFTPMVAPEPADKGSKAAKAIIGTLLGATAGAAIAYAMVKSESGSSPPTMPQYSQPAASIPALLPGSYPPSSQAQAQPQVVYKALEAPPARSFHSERLQDSYSYHSHGIPSKNPRAETIYETTEYRESVGPRDIVYPEGSYGVRRSSEGTVYMDMPIRAIEYSPPKSRTMSYPHAGSTLISTYVERDRNREISDYESVREGDRRSEHSASTVKPIKSTNTHVSSHRSSTSSTTHYSKSSKRYHSTSPSQATSHRSGTRVLGDIDEMSPSTASSTRTARNIALPQGSTTEYSTHSHKSKTTVVSARPHVVNIKASEAMTMAPEGELSENDSDVTPEDSISQIGTSAKSSRSHHSHAHHHNGHHGSHAQYRSSHPSTTSKRSNGSSKSKRTTTTSKFDEPVKPSDSISQVSINTASKHSSRHSRVVV